MKSFLKRIIVSILGWQIRRLRKHNEFKIIGVVGSYGKTSTKAAIAQALSLKYTVQWQAGNYNDIVSVPLIFFGLNMPTLMSPKAWLKTLWRIEKELKKPYQFDVVVLELGTDGPGQLADFARYLQLDIVLVTSVGAEHMEFFETVDEVAREELSVGCFAKRVIVNANLVDQVLLALAAMPEKTEQFKVKLAKKSLQNGWQLTFDKKTVHLEYPIMSEAQIYSLSSAYVVAKSMNFTEKEIDKSLRNIKGIAGRMTMLRGKHGSRIIDDTYNASPEATKLALETLYAFPAKHRIALLGNMNELGALSPQFHTEIGALCEPKLLDLVITLGADANEYLAKAAEAKGCSVVRTQTPQEAGQVLDSKIKKDTVVLAKGSQNGVFAEEAIKYILADPNDVPKLVRQNPAWLNKKQRLFTSNASSRS